MAPGSGDRKDAEKLSAARRKYDSEDLEVENMSSAELARHTALNVHWLRKGQQAIQDQVDNLVPEAVCEARTKAITAELKAASEGVVAKVHNEVARQVPPAVKSAIEDVTGVTKLTRLLEAAQKNPNGNGGTNQQSGLGWVKSNPKMSMALLTAILGLLGGGVVKGAYFIVDMDQSMQRREDKAAIREAKTVAVLRKVEKKIVPKNEFRLKPDAGVMRSYRPRSDRPRRVTQ